MMVLQREEDVGGVAREAHIDEAVPTPEIMRSKLVVIAAVERYGGTKHLVSLGGGAAVETGEMCTHGHARRVARRTRLARDFMPREGDQCTQYAHEVDRLLARATQQ